MYINVFSASTDNNEETMRHSSAAPISSVSHGSSSNGPSMSYVRKPATVDQWDRGEVNYTGDDRFHHIQNHLDAMINKNNNFY